MSDHITYEHEHRARLDLFLSEHFEGKYTRSYWQKMIQAGNVTISDIEKTAPSTELREGQTITINWPNENHAIPEVEVIYEDDDCIVLNKPFGLLTHSKGVFNSEATIADVIAPHLNESMEKTNRAGIVHRLDRATSGIIIAAKNPTAATHLQKQFSQRRTKKTYLAVVEGLLKDDAYSVEWPIARNPKKPQTFRVQQSGKSALTNVHVLKRLNKLTTVLLKPITGRTHQLRVHLSEMRHPIVGDGLYGSKMSLEGNRILLHAYSLEITLPNKERVTFIAPIPEDMSSYIHAKDLEAVNS